MENEQLQQINKILENTEYKAIAKINQGSFGQVYSVINKQNKPFAIKILDRAKLKKLSKEHQALVQGILLKKLKFPGIITLYDTLLTEQYIVHVLELCPFGTLFELLKRIQKNVNLTTKKSKIILYYLSQTIETLDYLHSNGIIHRDLKPENILLGSDLRAKFCDFGSAKCINNNLYSPEQLEVIEKARDDYEQDFRRKSFVGSAHYISPEALKCEHTQATDVWSFGIMVYKIFHGKHPFEGTDSGAIFHKIKQLQVKMDPDIPAAIKQVIAGCLKKDPKQRLKIKFIKLLTYFKEVNFEKIFTKTPPITESDLKWKQQPKQMNSKLSYQVAIEKKMFFGNFKPRLLEIAEKDGRLTMAYKYVDSKVIKNQFQINMNDQAKITAKDQFQVVNDDARYNFRSRKTPVTQIVDKINLIIRNFYKLQ